MNVTIDNQRGQLVATLDNWGVVYVVVIGGANVRIGDDPRTLKADANDGIPFNSSIPAQQSFVWWKGQLFAISDVATNLKIQIPGQRQFTGV